MNLKWEMQILQLKRNMRTSIYNLQPRIAKCPNQKNYTISYNLVEKY
jgi:hypothetical protein